MGFARIDWRLPLVLGVALATASVPASAGGKVVTLEASSKWVLDYDESKCQLLREFGGPANPHLLRLYKTVPSQEFALTVSGKSFAAMEGRSPFTLIFGDQKPQKDVWGFDAKLKDMPALVWGSVEFVKREETVDQEDGRPMSDGIPAYSADEWIDSKGAAPLDRLQISQRGRTVVLETGSLGPVTAAFNKCLDSLVATWGLDPAKQRQRRHGPELKNWPKLRRELEADYPSAAFRVGEQAMVFVRVIVDEKGGVVECLAEKVTKSPTLESPICQLMRRAEFAPALDSAGQPMRSFFAQKIRYIIP